MDRRTALKVMVAVPATVATATAERPLYVVHDLVFRESAGGPALFDGGREDPGVVYEAFHETHEVWPDGRRVQVSQEPSGNKYRILEPDSTERFTFSFADHEGLGRPTVRLRLEG